MNKENQKVNVRDSHCYDNRKLNHGTTMGGRMLHRNAGTAGKVVRLYRSTITLGLHNTTDMPVSWCTAIKMPFVSVDIFFNLCKKRLWVVHVHR